jgi:AcrR family transcriptional regulator
MKRKDTKTRQAEIVGMAIEVIGEMGVSGLTTARLADRLKMSEPNLYRHFRDKEDILSSVIDEIGTVIMDRAGQIAAQDVPSGDRLERIVGNHFNEVGLRPGMPRLIFSEDMHIKYPALRMKLMERIGGYLSAIEGVIREGMADGSFRTDISPKETAHTCLGMIQFTVMRWSVSGFSFSLDEEAARLRQNFYRMIMREGN